MCSGRIAAIHSMTGFGSASKSNDLNVLSIEIKSCNSRYLDILFRGLSLPPQLELEIRSLVSRYLSRGRVEISYSLLESDTSQSSKNSYFNPEIFNSVVNEGLSLITQLSSQNKIKEMSKVVAETQYDLVVSHALRRASCERGQAITSGATQFADKTDKATKAESLEACSAELLSITTSALKQVVQMRHTEGKRLCDALKKDAEILEDILEKIKSEVPSTVDYLITKSKERLSKIIDNQAGLDAARIHQEVAILADKADVSEELNRLDSHLRSFGEILKLAKSDHDNLSQEDLVVSEATVSKGVEQCGKKLDFLLQEIHRELNTTSVKSQSATVQGLCIEGKLAVERLKEQVQNIE